MERMRVKERKGEKRERTKRKTHNECIVQCNPLLMAFQHMSVHVLHIRAALELVHNGQASTVRITFEHVNMPI